MSARADIIVLGAGMVGVSVALHLQRRGRDVALIDRRDPGEETPIPVVSSTRRDQLSRVDSGHFRQISAQLNDCYGRVDIAAQSS